MKISKSGTEEYLILQRFNPNNCECYSLSSGHIVYKNIGDFEVIPSNEEIKENAFTYNKIKAAKKLAIIIPAIKDASKYFGKSQRLAEIAEEIDAIVKGEAIMPVPICNGCKYCEICFHNYVSDTECSNFKAK